MFHDLDFVSSNVEINVSLGQKQTVLLMCGWWGQFFVIIAMNQLVNVFKK